MAGVALALLIVAGTLRLPAPVPVALVQLNLKLPAEVIARWRAAAEAAGERSVRDWLLAITTAGPGADPAAAPGLEARLAALEEKVAALAGDRDFAASPLSARAESSPCPGEPGPGEPASPARGIPAVLEVAPLPDRRLTPDEAAGLLTVQQVARALNLRSDASVTNWIAREAERRGGSAVGSDYRGFRLRGKALLPAGSRPGWLWERL